MRFFDYLLLLIWASCWITSPVAGDLRSLNAFVISPSFHVCCSSSSLLELKASNWKPANLTLVILHLKLNHRNIFSFLTTKLAQCGQRGPVYSAVDTMVCNGLAIQGGIAMYGNSMKVWQCNEGIDLVTLQWRYNGHTGVSNHEPHHCLLHPLFRQRSKKISKLHVTGFCARNSLVTSEFPAQMASNVEKASIWWHHQDPRIFQLQHWSVKSQYTMKYNE